MIERKRRGREEEGKPRLGKRRKRSEMRCELSWTRRRELGGSVLYQKR